MTRRTLDQLAQSCAGPFAFCGIALSHKGARSFHVGTAPGITADATSIFRSASISKIVTGRAFIEAAGKVGLNPPYDLDIAQLLGWDASNRSGPITLGMVLSHTAGLKDKGVPAASSLGNWRSNGGDALFGARPLGTCFSYANPGYVLVAAAVEALTHQPFDRFATQSVLQHLGCPAGFNWSGIAPPDRASALPTYRREKTGFAAQVDTNVPHKGVIAPDGTPYDLSGYTPGWNPTVFAPHGGLRTSLQGLLALSETLTSHDPTPLWSPHMGEMDGDPNVLESYGAGVQIFDAPTFYPRPLIGHAACAYGFKGGVWLDRATGASFAYALNGLPPEPDSDGFEPEDLEIFSAVARCAD